MNWITEDIAIGDYLEAGDRNFLSLGRFRSVLCLDGSLSKSDPEELGLEEFVVVELKDGPGNDLRSFQKAVKSLIELVEDFPPVLVQCHAGRSRSVVVVAGFLMESLNIRPEEAVSKVARKREINISAGLEKHLQLPRLESGWVIS
jgi:protein-tyrosine phosphatase